jgi:hypothetical protein
MNKIILGLGVGIAIALAFSAGWFLGRSRLEREWRLPPMTLSEADVSKLKAGDADPVPRPGSKILAAMPLERSRQVLRELTGKDPIKAVIGSLGRSDEGSQMTLVLKSEAPCEVTSVEGVAYGFDSWGRSAKMNRGGEHFVAFASKDGEKIAPKEEKKQVQLPLKHIDAGSIALAQVDRYKCADGTSWARP